MTIQIRQKISQNYMICEIRLNFVKKENFFISITLLES